MKKISFWVFLIIFMILFPRFCLAERYINQSIPIEINDTIYFEDNVGRPSQFDDAAVVSIRFIYLGIKKGQIVLKRIDHQWSATKGSKDLERIVEVFLLNNKGKLRIQPKSDRLTPTQLIIEIVDKDNGIKVEEADIQ